MTTTTMARPRLATTAGRPFAALARIEAARMLRHPAPWLGILLWAAASYAVLASTPDWSSAQYQSLQASAVFLAAGVSVAAAYAAGRDRVGLAEDAPLLAEDRAAARLVGGLGLVALVALVAAGRAVAAVVRRSRPRQRARAAPCTPTSRCPSCSSRWP